MQGGRLVCIYYIDGLIQDCSSYRWHTKVTTRKLHTKVTTHCPLEILMKFFDK